MYTISTYIEILPHHRNSSLCKHFFMNIIESLSDNKVLKRKRSQI